MININRFMSSLGILKKQDFNNNKIIIIRKVIRQVHSNPPQWQVVKMSMNQVHHNQTQTQNY